MMRQTSERMTCYHRPLVHTGPGRPDDPGAHGRENAAQKQRDNPGKGSKGGDDDWEDRIRDAIDDDDDDRKDNDKHKDKKKGGKDKTK